MEEDEAAEEAQRKAEEAETQRILQKAEEEAEAKGKAEEAQREAQDKPRASRSRKPVEDSGKRYGGRKKSVQDLHGEAQTLKKAEQQELGQSGPKLEKADQPRYVPPHKRQERQRTPGQTIHVVAPEPYPHGGGPQPMVRTTGTPDLHLALPDTSTFRSLRPTSWINDKENRGSSGGL